MQFENVGAHCDYQYCHQKDFLPFRCGKCSKMFCLAHRTCKDHECPYKDADEVLLIICPICGMKIKITGADDPSEVFDAHSKTSCNPELVKPVPKERCDAEGCYAVLTPINTYSCAKCGGLKYCLKHRFPDSHNCYPFKATKLKSKLVTGAKTEAKKPATEVERCPYCLMSFPLEILVQHCDVDHKHK